MGKSIALYSSTQYGMNLYYILPGPSRECNRPVVAIFHIHLIWFFNLFEVPISLRLLPLPIPVGTRIPTSFRLEVHSYRQVRIEYQSSRDGRPDKRSARSLPHPSDSTRGATCFSQSVMSLFDCHRSFLPPSDVSVSLRFPTDILPPR